MAECKMGAVESRFADIIWANEPISSTELAKRALEAFGWKKSTTYTVLKRLCDKGMFKNENGSVTSVVSKTDYYSAQSEKFVEETFDGSLPAFITAFTARKQLSQEEINELKQMLDNYKG